MASVDGASDAGSKDPAGVCNVCEQEWGAQDKVSHLI